MTILTKEHLLAIDPRTKAVDTIVWAAALNHAFIEFGLTGKEPIAMYLGMALGESGGLRNLRENMMYTDAERCAKIFYSSFRGDPAAARPYVGNPRALANRVYAGIGGNGNEASGDGWLYRGIGPTQVTFANSIRGFFKSVGMTENLEYLLTPEGGARISTWFFVKCGGHRAKTYRECYALFQRGGVGFDLHDPYYQKAMQVL